MRFEHVRPAVLAAIVIGLLSFVTTAGAETWPCWRGPRGDGTCLEKGVPTNWDVAQSAVWKTAVPGAGHASAVVWGNRVYTVTALPEKRARMLLCLDRATGKILWQKTVVEGPLEKINPENSYASGTPATDGKRVYVTFRVGDDVVVAAHDAADGHQLWLVRPGTHVGEWGFSNEPVLFEDKVIIDGDSKGDSFLIAVSRDDGRTLWRVDRTHRGISYSAPLVREIAGRLQLVQCGDRCVASFDPRTGKELWTVDGPSEEFVATPVYDSKTGLVFVSSSWPQRHLLAIKPDGSGNVTQTHVAWRDSKGAPYVPSMIVAGDCLLSVNSGGTAFCYDAASGKVLWQERLGRHHASPVLIEGLVYFINDDGQINVIRPGAKFDRVAKYELGEHCYASPAISDGQVFLRGFEHMFCIGKAKPAMASAAAVSVQAVSVKAVSVQTVSVQGAPTPAAAPDFGPNVLIFDPTTEGIQARIDAVFKKQERSQFGPNRYAYLFKPGKYNLDVQVGFYMQVLGLGQSPDDVAITGAVRSKANWMSNHNATCNFWRSVENLSVTPTQDNGINIWAVSQATGMRRVHVLGNMNLWDGGWSSGGFLADCRIDGQINSGSQQQWFSRNTQFGKWTGGSWNMVFVGTVNPPAGTWPTSPYTVIDKTPVAREKPYLVIDDGGRYQVMVPSLQTGPTQGTTWSAGKTPAASLPIERFYLAHPDKDNATSINAALGSGKHLLFTPGIYHLESSIRVTRPDTVVLGLGYPTLVPDKGTAAMEVADVDGVLVGGLLFETGATNSATLLQVGEPGATASHAKNPVFLYDICCRAGGAAVGKTTCFLTIHSNDVVGDNFWLWRADHGRGAGWKSNENANGLVVNGNNVTVYGLFVEHCQQYQTLWNGNGGRVYFYQSELPYDPPSQEAWRHGTVNGYASYKVADTVTTHEAWGLGVYCVFYAAPVVCENAIETPTAPGVKMHHMVTIRLSGRPGSGMNHVINGTGGAVITTRKAVVD